MRSPSAATFLAVLLAACGGGGELRQSDLLLLWTSNVHGYIEPCGCQFGMIGGIDRIATYVAKERAAHPASLWIDGGDLVSETMAEDDLPLRMQLPIKARALLKVWSEIGCDALALGENELALGHERVRAWSEEFGVPVICANLADERGDLVFDESVVLERGGLRIGVFSVLAPLLQEAVVGSTKRIDVTEVAAEQGLRVLPWRPAVQRVAEALAAECDLVLFASHAGFENNVEVAPVTEAIDLVFGGHFGAKPPARFWTENDVPVLVSAVRGSRVGRVEWWFDEQADYFESGGRERVHDVSDWVEFAVGAEIAAAELSDLDGREAAMDPERWQQKQQVHTLDVNRCRAELAELGPPPAGNKLSAVQVQMYFGIGRSEQALRAIDEYHDEVNAFWRGRDSTRAEGGPYVGPETCKGCHPRQYEFWRATGHSRAFSTLQATGQEVDAECIGCHTVGYRDPGGFAFPNRHAGFENVECAACHGPGARHIRGGDSYLEPGTLTSGVFACARCHNSEHDPSFDEQVMERIELVACPPLEPPGQGAPRLLETYRVIAERMQARSEPDFGLLAEIWKRAGDAVSALEASERWLEQDPRNPTALVVTGMHYLESGRHGEALPLFRRVVQAHPNNATAQLGLGAALLPSDPEAAGMHAREAFSILPSADAVELVARASIALGRLAEACDSIAEWIASHPADEQRFAPLLATAGC